MMTAEARNTVPAANARGRRWYPSPLTKRHSTPEAASVREGSSLDRNGCGAPEEEMVEEHPDQAAYRAAVCEELQIG